MADEGLGSLDGGLQDPEMQETKSPGAPQLAPVKPQPCNQATMMCLRGPCVHLWRLTLRFDSSVKDVMHEQCWTCLASAEEFELNDRLVYFCDRWWPQATFDAADLVEDADGDVPDECYPACDGELHEVPERLRGVVRPGLHASWEACLRAVGYDFSWRDFDPTRNVDDEPGRRRFNAPGVLEDKIEAVREAAEAEAAGLPPATSIPEDDPPPVKTPEEEAAEAEAEYIHQMLLEQQEEEDDAV